MMNIKIIKKRLRDMNWSIIKKDELVEDQMLVAVWEDKVIEVLKDGTVYLLDLYSKKTDRFDGFGDPIYRDVAKKFEVRGWKELRNILVKEDFITAPVKDYIKSKRERQVLFLHLIEGLERKDISKILGVSNINLNSIIYRLNKRIKGIKVLHNVLEKAEA